MSTKDTYGETDPLSIIVTILEKSNRDALAIKLLDAFSEMATGIEQFNLLAKLYLDVRDLEKTEKFSMKVLDMSKTPDECYNARSNLAKMYNNVNEPTKSLFYSKINKHVILDDTDTLLEMVFSYYLLNEKAAAEVILRDLKAVEHTLNERHRNIVNFNLGTYDMEQGHFLKGLAGFLINIKKLELWFSPRELPYKYWKGGIYPGKTLILFMEGGGIGDEFITIRFMKDLRALGFKPIYFTSRPDLCNIFNRCGFETVLNLDTIPSDAMWTYAMQVPLWLEKTPESMLYGKYLYPSHNAIDKWNYIKELKGIDHRINSTNVEYGNAINRKLRIGVRWQGNAKNERDLHRKVPISGIMKILHEIYNDDEVEYYSLQLGDGTEELVNYPELIDISANIKSFDDTFAILENLDFVITSCTSILHAAAIVGTRTYGLIPISAYFTWLSPTPGRPERTSIWYGDNLRLFRQVTPNGWVEPLQELKQYIIANE